MEALLKANDSMIEATSKVKKQKVQQSSLSHMECVAMRLWDVQKDLRKNYDDAGLSAIEVEVSMRNVSFGASLSESLPSAVGSGGNDR